tara:strand:+ start:314 stop:433 length:120 start_codon:yes stop_codon:yes gene_type:complete
MKDFQKDYIRRQFIEIKKKINFCYAKLHELEDYILGDEK